MTKPVTILLALAASFYPMIEARACTQGKYMTEIDNELKRVNLPTQKAYEDHSLFSCGSDGWIRWQVYCGNCVDGGSGKSDYCM
ncbi:hypothetical protein BKA67DRAFT_658501 [Truncatella angustata]|uniref:Uncharacterized protein n=1 Tax=Truncatella angustata TaxID=152316 RepID=A0A9P8ZWW5_9PEZI|nr:uncharacterized protein BKA67DRAFT_658501 [Truncatella angustata]KAH6654182.1 hypothetical protein BKA67DRAFT_658501 [Truncatella angustata]